MKIPNDLKIEKAVAKAGVDDPWLQHPYLVRVNGPWQWEIQAASRAGGVIIPLEHGGYPGWVPLDAIKAHRARVGHTLAPNAHDVAVLNSDGDELACFPRPNIARDWVDLNQLKPAVTQDTFWVALNPKHLLALCEAIGCPTDALLEFQPTEDRNGFSNRKVIVVRPRDAVHEPELTGRVALMMPMEIPGVHGPLPEKVERSTIKAGGSRGPYISNLLLPATCTECGAELSRGAEYLYWPGKTDVIGACCAS